jgi:hypothetical protein
MTPLPFQNSEEFCPAPVVRAQLRLSLQAGANGGMVAVRISAVRLERIIKTYANTRNAG